MTEETLIEIVRLEAGLLCYRIHRGHIDLDQFVSMLADTMRHGVRAYGVPLEQIAEAVAEDLETYTDDHITRALS